jgi:hypothetical protein
MQLVRLATPFAFGLLFASSVPGPRLDIRKHHTALPSGRTHGPRESCIPAVLPMKRRFTLSREDLPVKSDFQWLNDIPHCIARCARAIRACRM